MKVKDMFCKEFENKFDCVDVYDNVCEELAIAFCPPLELTIEGENKFSLVLNDDVEIDQDNCVAVIDIDIYPEEIWQKHLDLLVILFNAAAGYCLEDDYIKWFKEV